MELAVEKLAGRQVEVLFRSISNYLTIFFVTVRRKVFQ